MIHDFKNGNQVVLFTFILKQTRTYRKVVRIVQRTPRYLLFREPIQVWQCLSDILCSKRVNSRFMCL